MAHWLIFLAFTYLFWKSHRLVNSYGHILLSENKSQSVTDGAFDPSAVWMSCPVLLLLLLLLRHTAAYYFRWVIEMQKHWQNSFTAMENCVMWKGTQIITSMHAHTCTPRHTQRRADTRMLVKENVIWHHVWRASSIVLPGFVLVVSGSQGGRGERRWKHVGWLLPTLSECVCSGVYYENRTLVWLWGTGHWNGIALLSAAFVILANHALKRENDKTKKWKNWEVYLRQNTKKISRVFVFVTL